MVEQPSELTPEERDILDRYSDQELYDYFTALIELVSELKIEEEAELERCALTGEIPFWIQPPLL